MANVAMGTSPWGSLFNVMGQARQLTPQYNPNDPAASIAANSGYQQQAPQQPTTDTSQIGTATQTAPAQTQGWGATSPQSNDPASQLAQSQMRNYAQVSGGPQRGGYGGYGQGNGFFGMGGGGYGGGWGRGGYGGMGGYGRQMMGGYGGGYGGGWGGYGQGGYGAMGGGYGGQQGGYGGGGIYRNPMPSDQSQWGQIQTGGQGQQANGDAYGGLGNYLRNLMMQRYQMGGGGQGGYGNVAGIYSL